MDSHTNTEPPTIEEAIQQYISGGSKSGNYSSNAESVLSRFQSFCNNRGISAISNVDDTVAARYASRLTDRYEANSNPSKKGGISANTAYTYFAIVSAFLTYCKQWEMISENPATKRKVKDKLPPTPSTDSSDQQFWSDDDRNKLIGYANRQAADAVDGRGLDAHIELRNKALVYLLSYSGCRGAEILSDPKDDRRSGVTWADIDLEEGIMTILGKNQKHEQAPLPPQTHKPLLQLKRAVNPSSDDWPVIISNHAPSIYNRLPDSVDTSTDDNPLDYCRDTDTRPPALSTNGARNLLERLCDRAEIDVDEGYLKPHGGRRGVGEKLYRNRGAAAAQRTLRHADPKTTSEMYSHIESSELSDDVGVVFEED